MKIVKIGDKEIDLDSPKVKEAKGIEDLRKLKLFGNIEKDEHTKLLDKLWAEKKNNQEPEPEPEPED